MKRIKEKNTKSLRPISKQLCEKKLKTVGKILARQWKQSISRADRRCVFGQILLFVPSHQNQRTNPTHKISQMTWTHSNSFILPDICIDIELDLFSLFCVILKTLNFVGFLQVFFIYYRKIMIFYSTIKSTFSDRTTKSLDISALVSCRFINFKN